MNRLLFVSVLGLVFVVPASAEPPVAPAPTAVTTTPAPVMSSVPAPMVVNTVTTPAHRMGLFGRIRARNTNPMLPTTASYFPTTSTMPTTTVPAAMPTTTPMPMPGTTSSVTGNPVVVAGGFVPAEGTTMPMTTGMPMTTVMGASTMPMTEMVMTPAPHRMGLIARLRARRN